MTRMTTSTINIRPRPPAAWTGGAAGSAKTFSSLRSGATLAPSLRVGTNGSTLFNGFSCLEKIVETRTNKRPIGQSLDQRLDARRGEISFVTQKLPHGLGIERPGDDFLRWHDRRVQKEIVNRVDVVRERLTDINRERRKRVMLTQE